MSREQTMIEAVRVVMDKSIQYERFLNHLLYQLSSSSEVEFKETVTWAISKIITQLKTMRGETL